MKINKTKRGLINLRKMYKLLLFATLTLIIVTLGACSEKTPNSGNSTENDNPKSSEENVNTPADDVDELSDYKIENVWMEPTKAGEDAKVYLSLHNESDEQLDLHDAMIIGVSHQVEFRQGDEGYSGWITVPAGETFQLAPGEVHMVLKSIEQDMNAGDPFTLSLHLTPHGDVDVQGTVK